MYKRQVVALEEGEEKNKAEARLKDVKAVYDKVTKLDMSDKTDGFLQTSDGKTIDLHAALVYFTNLETLNLSNNCLLYTSRCV